MYGGGGGVRVDGDLSEWTNLAQGYFGQGLNPVQNRLVPGRDDHAAVALSHDRQDLYIAVRVIDKSVINAFEPTQYPNGDGVEILLDLRPASPSNGPKLGASRKAGRLYRLYLVPPDDQNRAARWHNPSEGESTLSGPIELAGRRLPDGYALEAGVPLASFSNMAAERLVEPIGVGVVVNDIDADGERKPSKNHRYTLFEGRRYPPRPTELDRLLLVDKKPSAKDVRTVPARLLRVGSGYTVRAVLIAPHDKNAQPCRIDLGCRFGAGALERGGAGDAEDPEINVLPETMTPLAALGVSLHTRDVRIPEVCSGRHTVRTAFAGLEQEPYLSRYYAQKRGGTRSSFEEVAAASLRADLADLLAHTETYLSLKPHYTNGERHADGFAFFRLSTPARWLLSETLEQSDPRYALRVDLESEAQKREVWAKDMPFTNFLFRFTVPLDGLEKGLFWLDASVVGPEGEALPVSWKSWGGKATFTPIAPLRVMARREIRIKSTVSDTPAIAAKAVKLGNPQRDNRFSKDNVGDCLARSVWDMQLYEGRIYVGAGDWISNRGPIDIWSFGPAPPGSNAGFHKEFTIDGEAVETFRVYGNTLYVPDIDPREPHDLGNLYMKSAGKWTKRRTIPGGVHVFDTAAFQGKLYVVTHCKTGAGLFESQDQGRTWRLCPVPDERSYPENKFHGLARLGDSLLLFPGNLNQSFYRYTSGRIERVFCPLYPDAKRGWPRRLKNFAGGVLYAPQVYGLTRAHPLYYLGDLGHGARVVEAFESAVVQDILVRDSTCYVLASPILAREEAEKATQAIKGSIYRSRDLRQWTRIASLEVPGRPCSFELMGGTFYVGLGSLNRSRRAKVVCTESGSIYRLDGVKL